MEKERRSSEEESAGEIRAGCEEVARARAGATGAGKAVETGPGEARGKSTGGREGGAANQTDVDIQEVV